MSDKKRNNKEPTYEDREKLDTELNAAIADILSAEGRARACIEQAAASVKAIQLDRATHERDMRYTATVAATKKKDGAIAQAIARGDAEAARLKLDAEKSGAALLSSKSKAIDALAHELFESL